MGRQTELGKRKTERIELRKPGFVVLEPNGAWFECLVLDISEGGVCVEVGDLPVNGLFSLILTPKGEVRRTCATSWRRGGLLGARFVKLTELRAMAKETQLVC